MLGSRALQNPTWHWLTVQCVSPASFYHFSPCSTYRSPSFSLLPLSSSWISFEPFSLSSVVDNCVFVFNWLHTLLTDSQSQHKHTHFHTYAIVHTNSILWRALQIPGVYATRIISWFVRKTFSGKHLNRHCSWQSFCFDWRLLVSYSNEGEHTHTCLSSYQTIKGHLEAIIILDRFLFPWKIEELITCSFCSSTGSTGPQMSEYAEL